MNTRYIFTHSRMYRSLRIWLPASLWVTGLCIGVILAVSHADNSKALLDSILSETPSSILMLAKTALPIVCCGFAIGCSAFALVYPLVLLEATSFGFCAILLFEVFGSGAWLIRLLCLFSSSISCVLMWWLLFRHSKSKAQSFSKDIRLACALSFLITIVDFFIITPFLADLTKYF